MQFNNPSYAVLSERKVDLTVNQVLRKTYFLLSLTLLFSAFTAVITLMGYLPYAGPGVTLLGMFGLMFLTHRLSESKWGLCAIFAFTGFMGYVLAPIIAYYLQSYQNGGALLLGALGGTGGIFLGLSLYTLLRRKDYSYMGGVLFIAISLAVVGAVISIFFPIPIFSVLVSCLFVLVCSGLIMFRTSQIIHGGEKNYIIATVGLYVSIFNLFISLLRILSFFAGRRS